MCTYVCIHIYIYIHMYIFIYICIHICIYICIHVYTYLYIYICTPFCRHTHIYIYIYIRTFAYICSLHFYAMLIIVLGGIVVPRDVERACSSSHSPHESKFMFPTSRHVRAFSLLENHANPVSSTDLPSFNHVFKHRKDTAQRFC